VTRGETELIPSNLKVRRKLSLNLDTHNETTQEYLHKQIETDRSVQTVWCEYTWKLSVNSKGGILSYVWMSDSVQKKSRNPAGNKTMDKFVHKPQYLKVSDPFKFQ